MDSKTLLKIQPLSKFAPQFLKPFKIFFQKNFFIKANVKNSHHINFDKGSKKFTQKYGRSVTLRMQKMNISINDIRS